VSGGAIGESFRVQIVRPEPSHCEIFRVGTFVGSPQTFRVISMQAMNADGNTKKFTIPNVCFRKSRRRKSLCGESEITLNQRVGGRVLPGSPNLFNNLASSEFSLTKMDCTLEMRQLRWAHFAGKGLPSEAKAILTEFQRMAVERMRSSDNIGNLAEELE